LLDFWFRKRVRCIVEKALQISQRKVLHGEIECAALLIPSERSSKTSCVLAASIIHISNSWLEDIP
jgi:hypothetical protein